MTAESGLINGSENDSRSCGSDYEDSLRTYVILMRTCIITAAFSACSSDVPVACRIFCRDILDVSSQVSSAKGRKRGISLVAFCSRVLYNIHNSASTSRRIVFLHNSPCNYRRTPGTLACLPRPSTCGMPSEGEKEGENNREILFNC